MISSLSSVALVVRLNSISLLTSAAFFWANSTVERITGKLSSVSPPKKVTWIALRPADLLLDVAVGRGLEAAVEGALAIGPASRALQDQPPDVRAAAGSAIRAALAPYQKGQSVALGAAIWVVTATNG